MPRKEKKRLRTQKRKSLKELGKSECPYRQPRQRKLFIKSFMKERSNKINYDVLNDLKCQSGLQPATPVDSQPPPTPLQTEDLSEASRMVESNGSHIARDIKEPDRKKIKLEKMDFRDSKTESLGGDTSAVVVENGPVQYIENLKEEEADLEEEEELDDEDEPVSAAKLLGHHHQVQDYEDHDLYDDD